MADAAGAHVRVGELGHFGGAACIEQMKDRQRRFPVFANTEKTMPEGAAADRGDLHPVGVNLAMQFVEAVDGEVGQGFGIDLDAAVGGGFQTIRESRAVAFHGARGGVEQQGSHRGTAGVETYNELI